ncbi:MAG: diguanylate cyclase [Pseudomonadota bacterium]
MPPNPKNGASPRALTRRYTTTISLIALLSLAGHLLVQYVLASQDWDSNTINLAGRQRLVCSLLIQDAVTLWAAPERSLKVRAAASLRENLAQWNRVHQGLLDGDPDLGLSGDNSPEMLQLFDQMESSRAAVAAAAKEILVIWDQEDSLERIRALVSGIQRDGRQALDWLDQAASRYSAEAQGRVAGIKFINYFFLFAVFAVLLCDALFVFRPAVSRIGRHIEEMNLAAEKLRRLSEQDGLTGAPNRRVFEEYFQTEWQRAQRTRRPLSLIMLDVDFFKNYNDTYGHQAGDDVLVEIARSTIANARRPADLAARYGGEEFVVLLPETELDGAGQVAEKIARDIEGLAIAHSASSVASVVTVSLGVACLTPCRETSPTALLKAADEALYLAKNRGRNQVALSTASGVGQA